MKGAHENMNYYYQYQGTISMSSDNSRSCILDDVYDYKKPPIALTVPCEGLANYLEQRGWTDAEERYLTQTWIYDRNLFLWAVVIPSTDDRAPAKVIACADPDRMSSEIVIFGPEELIESSKPEPISNDDLIDWLNFRGRFGLHPLN